MMEFKSGKDDGAFACVTADGQDGNPGLTAQEYAAIQLKVPNSGTEWLDEMIRQSLRLEAERMALAGLLASPNVKGLEKGEITEMAFQYSHYLPQAWSKSDG